MFFASTKRRNASQSGDASISYASLEARRLLAFLTPPLLTNDVAEYAQTVEDAVIRVDDQQRLIIRTTGESNRVDFGLEHNYLQVNRESYSTPALQIDPGQYDRIILISEGDDQARVSGRNLVAQLHPDKLWVSASVSLPGKDVLYPIQIHGSNFERLEVNENHFSDVGPFIHTSNNRIRMYGSDGVDRLDMSSDENFAIATSVSMTGEGYHYSSNVFGDLYVSGGGGQDFASLAGTRGFADGSFVISESTTGNDVYVGRDNYSQISNELWNGRFVDFETQRVNLLSGEDRSVIEDDSPSNTWYRVDGQDLVGNFRRIIGSEFIEIDGGSTGADTLFRPDEIDAVFIVSADEFQFRSDELSGSNVAGEEDGDEELILPYIEETIPDYFAWKFVSFERLVG